MRTQFCREHIDAAAESCDIDPKTVVEIKRATEFAYSHPLLDLCATSSILTLMRIPDPEVKALTIRHVETLLKEKTPTGGIKTKRLSENQIKEFRARFELQVSTARQKEAIRLRKEAEKNYAGVKEIANAEEE